MHMRLLAVALLASLARCSLAQVTTPLERASDLEPYTHCSTVAGARLTETTKLVVPNSIRMVQTADGNRQVPLVDGLRLAYAFPNSAPFVSIKVEALSRDHYAQGKVDLLSNFNYLLKSDELAESDVTQPQLAGFEVHGITHKELIGNVLGVYLILDDAHAVEATIYLLNAEPSQRHFATFEEYVKTRREFVGGYIDCVKQNAAQAEAAR